MTPVQDNLKKAPLQAEKDPKSPRLIETQTLGKGLAFSMDSPQQGSQNTATGLFQNTWTSHMRQWPDKN